jgi:hypothetical protein
MPGHNPEGRGRGKGLTFTVLAWMAVKTGKCKEAPEMEKSVTGGIAPQKSVISALG